MSLIALSALKLRLAADADLTAFFSDNYNGKAVRHWLGYRHFVNANDYPLISYAPVKSKRTYTRSDQYRVSIVLGLNNPDPKSDAVSDVIPGVARSSEAEDLIVAALANAIIAPGYKIERDSVDVIYDLGTRHPFYETEFSLLVTQYDQLETGIVPSEVWAGLAPAIGDGFSDHYEQLV